MRSYTRPGAMALLAVCGAAIAAGALLTWVAPRGTRPGAGLTHTSVAELVRWNFGDNSQVAQSVAGVVLLLGILVLFAGLLGWRFGAALFCLLSFGAGAAWLGLFTSRYSHIDMRYSDLRTGAWLTLAGSFIGLITAFFLRARRRRRAQ